MQRKAASTDRYDTVRQVLLAVRLWTGRVVWSPLPDRSSGGPSLASTSLTRGKQFDELACTEGKRREATIRSGESLEVSVKVVARMVETDMKSHNEPILKEPFQAGAPLL